MDINTAQTSIYVTSAMQIFTDLSCSLLPFSLLTDGRATREKVGICSMIFIGLLATAAAIYKMSCVKYFDFNVKGILAHYTGTERPNHTPTCR